MTPNRPIRRLAALLLLLCVALAACTSDEAVEAADTSTETTEATATTEAAMADDEPTVTVRESGMTVTVQALENVTVHSLTAPEAVFANSTHIFETADSLVLVDAQFLLPNAADVRAYAESLGKPMDRLFISHAHPDHFLGAEAFADVPQYALADVVADIEANGQAEVDEKQADFGEAIAGSFVVPEVVEPGELVLGGTTFELSEVLDAEAHTQLVIRVPADGVVATGDLIYSGVHLILAGPADTWTAALEGLQANGDTVILPGHGLPAGAEVIDANIAYLATTMELLGSVDNADDFRDGLLAAYPDLTMEAAIDFATPVLFPNG